MLLSLIPLLAIFGTSPDFDEAAWRAKTMAVDPAGLSAPHVRDGVYFNPWLAQDKHGFSQLLRWRLGPQRDYTPEEESYLPRVRQDSAVEVAKHRDEDFLVWLGHSTFLIHLAGEYWLTDPIFFGNFLPKRQTALPLQPGDIASPLHLLISHAHYDHLQPKSVAALPMLTDVYVPLGLKATVAAKTTAPVFEMDWWQEIELKPGYRLVCLPAQHWSLRLTQRYNHSLWCMYLLITPQAKILFGGDSGYFIGFREIRRRYGPIDYALLPVGASEPRWFMHYAHLNVPEAALAARDLSARTWIPMHWGTFRLGDEPAGYPAVELQRGISRGEIAAGSVRSLDIGELFMLTGS
jgi:L-ascorbate metabolism protein UlaG (beta-lactamase superfamily)